MSVVPYSPSAFVERWKDSGGAELANSQSFLKELCSLLDVPQPDPTQPEEARNLYVFEKAVEFNNGDGTTSGGRIDLYRSRCFVLESKQGIERKEAEQAELLATRSAARRRRTGTAQRGTPGWEQAMVRARQQAKRYAEAIPDEWPPFLIVADVGHCFDIYADFSQSGKNYVPFPDPQTYRLPLDALLREEVRETLRALWLEPHSLDPARKSAKATRELADRLAKLARSLEKPHDAATVAQFLMRCLFTMFAEDVEIGGFTRGAFCRFLEARRGKLKTFVPMLEDLWRTMDAGGFSTILETQVKQFNGGLFEDHTALPLNDDQLELLIEAAQADWKDVEPAIFGTLLERALDPHERHKLGAHYTPRAYVERLVMPTIIEPLRAEWDTAYATAVSQYESGKPADARKTVRAFHEKLCETRVLDPACGSGNFLYVSLELMKRLEGEVLKALRDFGEKQLPLLTIDPHQFLGIEVNPRAAAITDLVLWIGYLQWHFRTRGKDPLNEPIIRKFHNIECRDAVLAWDAVEPVVDEEGNPVTRWDGRTTKPHPVTGEEVPDETARVQEMRYVNPRKADWPQADYIIGNPPFVGNFKMREALGDGYTKTIRNTFRDLPESCDYVMYWWHNAAELVRAGSVKGFGLIATNSLRQTFNRRVIEPHLEAKDPLSIVFAIPDHPWVDSAEGAAVRISMTTAIAGDVPGTLMGVVQERDCGDLGAEVTLRSTVGKIRQNLRIGADVAGAATLQANAGLSCPGVKLHGAGFIVSPEEAQSLGLGKIPGLETHIRGYRNGRDLTQSPRGVMVIDLFGLTADEAIQRYPEVYQRVLERVKPERDQNNRATYRNNWWVFGEPRRAFRPALSGLRRYIATVETAKHRFFVFQNQSILPDNTLINIAVDDAFHHGILSSRIHVTWALAAGGRLGVGNDPRYNKTRCFETFPFPVADEDTKQRIRELGEQLDAHRKRQQQLHPELTMTGMYNVLEKLRSGESLTPKEKAIHEQGLVSVLRQIHDDLDRAVCDAYGWPQDIGDEEILERLVALNHERAEEEARGIVRWLRPDFQNRAGSQETQKRLAVEIEEEEGETAAKPAKPAKPAKRPWPQPLAERFQALRTLLDQTAAPLSAGDVAKHFTRARKADVEELLATLASLGHIRETEDGRYVA